MHSMILDAPPVLTLCWVDCPGNDSGFNFGRTACYRIVGDAYRGAMGCTTGNRTLCEYPSAYLFFDEGHTTQSANEQLAKLIWSGDPSVTRPHNVEQLFEDED